MDDPSSPQVARPTVGEDNSAPKDQKAPWIVLIDHRENPKVIKKLQDLEGCTVEVLQLPVGDVVCADFAVERKSISDFLSSVYDSRVFNQVSELKSNYPNPILILHGYVHEYMSQVRGDAARTMGSYQAAIATIARMGVPILYAQTDKEYVNLILTLVKQSDPNRPASERPIQTHKPRDRTNLEEQEDVLCAISGLGRKKVRPLLDRFKTPLGVFQATEKELTEIEGIGHKFAQHIIEIGSKEQKDG